MKNGYGWKEQEEKRHTDRKKERDNVCGMCVSAHIFVCLHACVCMCVCNVCSFVYAPLLVFILICIYVCIKVCMYACVMCVSMPYGVYQQNG